MSKKILSAIAAATIVLAFITSCAKEPVIPENSSQVKISAESNPFPPTGSTSDAIQPYEEEKGDIGGGSELKSTYSFHYFNVDGSLIDYIGGQEFNDWWETNKERTLSILDLVKDFSISKEDFIAVTRPKMDESMLAQVQSMGYTEESWYDENVYSLEEIEAIYSNIPKEINRIFCSPIAVFNEADGQIYTLEWLATHTAEDYLDAKLSLVQIEDVLQRAQQEDVDTAYIQYAELAEASLENAYVLKEAALVTEEDLATGKPESVELEESSVESIPADDENAAE